MVEKDRSTRKLCSVQAVLTAPNAYLSHNYGASATILYTTPTVGEGWVQASDEDPRARSEGVRCCI